MSGQSGQSAFQTAIEELKSNEELTNSLFLQPLAQDLMAAWLESLFTATPYNHLVPVVKGGEYAAENSEDQPLENFVSVVASTAAPITGATRKACRAVAVSVTLQTSRDIAEADAAAVFSGILNLLQAGTLEEGLPPFIELEGIPVVLAGRVRDLGEEQDVRDGARLFTKSIELHLAPARADNP